jgi:signal transduction histidine kinase
MMAERSREAGSEQAEAAFEVIGRATRAVVRRLYQAQESEAAASPDAHLIHDADSFQRALEDVVKGEDPAVAVSTLPTTAVPLVGLVRAQLLGDAAAAAEVVVRVLRGLDRLDRAWRYGTMDDGDADLRAWLSRPDAFELLVGLAHDLRSPLNSIIFLSETIRNAATASFTEVQYRQLGLIHIAALGLNTVLSDVVELAIDERDLVDDLEVLDFWVGEVFDELAAMLAPMSEEKGVELRLTVGDDDRWHGHPLAISRVLLNLTTNALKFTEEGYVEIGFRRLGSTEAEFFVGDTGRGIGDQQVADLFKPFRARGRDRGHYFSSSGLGLSICQRYLRAMGSTLEVETELGEGTRFSFRLTEPDRR